MLLDYKRGQGSIILRVKILDSSVSTGAGKTGLSSASSGLVISTIADNEASPTSYTVAGSTIEAVATLGTYAAPTATKCRFAEVSSTYHPGVYELHIADARFAVSSAKSLLISISGATNAAQCDAVIPLRDVDPYDAAAFGMSRLDAAVSTRSTLTQSEVTGGAYALNHASFAFNAALDFTTTQKAATITFTGPVNPITGEVTLIRGDDYFADDGRGLSYTVPYSGGNPDLTGATVTAAWHAGSTIATTVTAVVSGAGGPSQAVAIEIPRAKTALLTQSHYTLVLSAVLADGHVFTFMRQSCLVQPPRGS